MSNVKLKFPSTQNHPNEEPEWVKILQEDDDFVKQFENSTFAKEIEMMEGTYQQIEKELKNFQQCLPIIQLEQFKDIPKNEPQYVNRIPSYSSILTI